MLHHVLATYRYGVSVAALYAAAGAATVGGELLAGETNAMGIDFTYHTDVTKQLYISDLTTPANNYNGTPFGKLTYTSPSLKLCRQSDGVWRYTNHNLQSNSQTINSFNFAGRGITSITANAATAPDGTATAETLLCDNANNIHNAYNTLPTALPDGVPFRFSCFFKKGTHRYPGIVAFSGSANRYVIAVFDLDGGGSTATQTIVGSASGTATATAMTSVGSGWFYCMVEGVITGATTQHGEIAFYNAATGNTADASGNTSYVGAGTETFHAWGYQVKRIPVQDAGGFTYATGYLATTTAAVYDLPYEWDVANASQGILIEEARTNGFTYSQQLDNAAWTQESVSVTANATTAPNGTSTADLVIPSTGSAGHALKGASVYTTTVTISFFAKPSTYTKIGVREIDFSGKYASWDLSGAGSVLDTTGTSATISAEANGWYRCAYTLTPGADNAQFRFYVLDPTYTTGGVTGSWTGDGSSGVYFWNMQAESGSFATSPIHTTGATVTRAVDNISLAGASFPLAAPGAGSMIVQGQFKSVAAIQYFAALHNANTTELIGLSVDASANPRCLITDGGATQDDVDGGTLTANTTAKFAAAWNTNDTATVLNGASAVAGDGTSTLPTPTTLNLGGRNSANEPMSGYLCQFTYLKRRATNVELQSRTS